VHDLSDSQARVDIRWVGGLQLFLVSVRVFIDHECEGGLNTTHQSVQPFLVAPGLHTVDVKCALWKSETLAVNVSAGEKATFKCGFRREVKRSSLPYLAMFLAGNLLATSGLPLTGLAAFGLGVVAILFAVWRDSITPGSCLYLRPQAELPLLELPAPPIMQRPRMTIRGWMVLVAVIAFLLGIGVEEHLMQRRAEIERRQEAQIAIRRDQYLSFAKIHADTESLFRKSEARRTELEASILNRIETLSSMSRSEPERDPGNADLQDEKRRLDLVRVLRAKDAQMAASAAQLKEKYLNAARHPSEPVIDEPPPPGIPALGSGTRNSP
jgi:hypothetical protein